MQHDILAKDRYEDRYPKILMSNVKMALMTSYAKNRYDVPPKLLQQCSCPPKAAMAAMMRHPSRYES